MINEKIINNINVIDPYLNLRKWGTYQMANNSLANEYFEALKTEFPNLIMDVHGIYQTFRLSPPTAEQKEEIRKNLENKLEKLEYLKNKVEQNLENLENNIPKYVERYPRLEIF